MTRPLIRIALATAIAAVAYEPTTSAVAQANTSGVPVPPQPTWTKSDKAIYGTQIATYVDTADSGWVDSYSKSTITVINARGDKTVSKVRQMIKEGKGGNKALVRYMNPASVRGVAALTHEHHTATDDSWLYLPASRRVRRISGANRTASFQGTEFTYEDMSRSVPSRYKWTFVEEAVLGAEPVFVVEAVPTYKNSGYSKLVFYIHTKQWRGEKVEYFDKAGRRLKVLTFSKWKLYHGRFWRAGRMDMHNEQTQKRSVIDLSSQFVNIALYKKPDGSSRAGLKDSAFTRRALESR